MGFNEQDLIKLGFIRQSDGSYAAPGAVVDTRLPAAKSEPGVVPPLASREKVQDRSAGRVRVCITSYRVRLLDPDNHVVKWLVDCIRRANLCRNDTEADIALEVRQVKVKTKAEQGTLIEVSEI